MRRSGSFLIVIALLAEKKSKAMDENENDNEHEDD
jgi:hypothetical protein